MKKQLLLVLLGVTLLLTLTAAKAVITFNVITDTFSELDIEWIWVSEFETNIDSGSYSSPRWFADLGIISSSISFSGLDEISWSFEHIQGAHANESMGNFSSFFGTNTIDVLSTLPADNMIHDSGSIAHLTHQDDWAFDFDRVPGAAGVDTSVIRLHVIHTVPLPSSIMLFMLGLGLFSLRKKIA